MYKGEPGEPRFPYRFRTEGLFLIVVSLGGGLARMPESDGLGLLYTRVELAVGVLDALLVRMDPIEGLERTLELAITGVQD